MRCAVVSLQSTKRLLGVGSAQLAVRGEGMAETRWELLQPGSGNIWRIGVPAGGARHFELTAYDPAGQAVYAGQARVDVPADGWVAVEIDLAHTNPQARCVELAYAGAGAGSSERFPLEAGLSYVVRARYRGAITVDLLDAFNGDRVERLLEERADTDEETLVSRVFTVGERLGFFLRITGAESAWRVEIQGGY